MGAYAHMCEHMCAHTRTHLSTRRLKVALQPGQWVCQLRRHEPSEGTVCPAHTGPVPLEGREDPLLPHLCVHRKFAWRGEVRIPLSAK